MKKVLMLLSLIAVSASMYGAEDTEVIKLEKGNIYSKGKVSESIRNSISSKYIIDAEEIEKKKYTSLGEVLRDISGVNISSELDMRGHGIGNSNLNSRPKLYVDGVLQNFGNIEKMGATPVYLVNLKDIEKVEVVPGGEAVVYGDGASSGVINIITKRNKGTSGNFEYRRGSYNNNLINVGAGTSLGKFGINFNYNKNKTDGFNESYKKRWLTFSEVFKNNTDFFSGKISYDINKNNDLSLQYNLHKERREISPGFENPGLKREKSREDYTRNKNEFVFKYNGKIDSHSLSLISFYQDLDYILKSNYKNYLKRPNKKNFVNGKVVYSDKKIGFNVKDKFNYGEKSDFTFGIGYKHNKLFYDFYEYMRWPNGTEISIWNDESNDFNKNTFEIFALNNYSYRNFIFTQGLRLENIKYSGERKFYEDEKKYKIYDIDKTLMNFSGNLGVNYLYSDTGNVYAKYELGSNSPSPEYKYNLLKSGEYVPNNLKSEQNNYFEIGWNDYFLKSLISADIYYGKLKNEIKYISEIDEKTGKQISSIYSNIGETQRYGFDLKAEQKFEKITFREGYSYINAKITKDSENNLKTGGNNEGKYIPFVAPHKFTLGIDYQATKKLGISLDASYSSDYYLNDANEKVDGKRKDGKVIMANLRANYQATEGLNIYVGINNLFDKEIVDYTNHRVYKKYFVTAPERNYYAGFSYKF